MKLTYKIILPFKPVVKKNNRSIGFNRKTGQRFPIKSPRLKEYEEKVTAILRADLSRFKLDLPIFKAKVKAVYTFYFKKKSRADWDNMPAAIQDCAQTAQVLANDKLIKEAQVLVIENAGEDKTIVYYEEL